MNMNTLFDMNHPVSSIAGSHVRKASTLRCGDDLNCSITSQETPPVNYFHQVSDPGLLTSATKHNKFQDAHTFSARPAHCYCQQANSVKQHFA
jgi:hypothetical protein